MRFAGFIAVVFLAALSISAQAATRSYQCSASDDRILTLVENSPNNFAFYLRSDKTTDESDIVFDGHSITSIETNGGVGKQATITRLFKFMVVQPRHLTQQSPLDVPIFTHRPPACPFHVDRTISP